MNWASGNISNIFKCEDTFVQISGFIQLPIPLTYNSMQSQTKYQIKCWNNIIDFSTKWHKWIPETISRMKLWSYVVSFSFGFWHKNLDYSDMNWDISLCLDFQPTKKDPSQEKFLWRREGPQHNMWPQQSTVCPPGGRKLHESSSLHCSYQPSSRQE